MELPLFPLSSLVLPEGRISLRLFERRYLDMVAAAMRSGDGFGICLISEGEETGKAAVPHPLGTLVHISDWDQGDDGLLHITCEGRQLFRILNTRVADNQLLIGEVALQAAEPPTPLAQEFGTLAGLLGQLLDDLRDYVSYPAPRLDDAVWVSNRLIELLPLQAQDKILLLQMQSSGDRLRLLKQLRFA
ncbi:LON peptidase substrate-binding domain-containing protein [Granulosicoccaceae sp. 1_MG-2023]|nr:LON peptidase substrate-binding domain-containing protein [Granulosicoccaceae sp. 1_MG-2023]